MLSDARAWLLPLQPPFEKWDAVGCLDVESSFLSHLEQIGF